MERRVGEEAHNHGGFGTFGTFQKGAAETEPRAPVGRGAGRLGAREGREASFVPQTLSYQFGLHPAHVLPFKAQMKKHPEGCAFSRGLTDSTGQNL